MTVKLTDHKLMKKAMEASCKEQTKVMKAGKKRVNPEFEETPAQIKKKSEAFIDLLKKTGIDKVLKKLGKE